MGNYNRGGFGGSGRSRGGGGGFRGRSDRFDRGRDGGFDRNRRSAEMYNAVCAKCGKECQVPFKPSGGRPVLCSDCFRQSGGGSRNDRFDRGRDGGFDRGRGDGSRERPSSGISSGQLNQINAKLDKILGMLENLELDTEDDDADESEDDSKEN